MDTGLFLVFAIVLLISFFVLKKKQNLPPSRFTIPYIGTVGLLWKFRGRRPHEVFVEEAKELGPVFSFRIANKLLVVLNGYDAIHEALVKNAETCSGRTDGARKLLKIESDEEGIIFNAYGQSWRELRRFTIQALRDFGVGKNSIEEKIFVEVEALTACLRKCNGKPLTFIRPVQKLVANVIYGIIFSRRYDFEDPKFDEILQMTNELFIGRGALNVTLFLPDFITSRLLSKNSEVATKNRLSDKMAEYISDQIDEHESTFDNDNIRDFVDFYWRTVKYGEASQRKYLTKKNIFRIIIDLFLAGSETTSTSLDWAMLFMTEFPEVQNKCQEEIERVIGDRNVTYADRNDLPYTYATVIESQRLSAIVPLSVPHMATQDTKLGGFDIPKDTILFPNIYSASLDPKYWDEPERFKPERFLNAAGKQMRPDAWIPFSTGPRECAGEPLAKMELFVVFTNLLKRFTFCQENENVRHSLRSVVGRTTNAPLPYKLRAVCRSD